MMMKVFNNCILMGLVLFLMACQESVLLQGLDQKNANDVLVMLSKNGVKATREAVTKQQQTTYTLKVDSADGARARELLVVNNLPREKELGLSGICKDAGLIPTPKTEKCREMLAIKGEVINSLQSIPGVVSADVVLNIPDKQEFADENTPQQRPTASVVVQVGNWADQEVFSESKIQQFVANAVSGLDTRDVAVIISRIGLPADKGWDGSHDGSVTELDSEEVIAGEEESDSESGSDVTVGGLSMDSASAAKFRLIASGVLIVFVLLAGALIFMLIKMVKNRQSSQVVTTALKPVLPEKNDMDQLVDAAAKD